MLVHKVNTHKFWFNAFLLLIFSPGCCNPNASNPGLSPPTVISEAPPKAATTGACPNTTVTATFSEAMNPTTVNTTTFTVAPGVAGTVTHDASNTIFTFTPSSNLALSTVYTATITTGAMDLFGIAPADNFVWTFTTGANPCQPPAPPISVTPANGSGGACSNIVVAAIFPQAMDPATINTTTFTVAPGVTGTVTPDVTNRIFTFSPSSNLALSTVYTATITTGAKDAFGNALANNFVWTFTTAAASCTPPPPPPTVISVAPPSGAVGVCPNTVVTATFSEVMDPATINTGTFTVSPGVTGTVTLDGTGRIAAFTPTANLALGTTYTATITTGAQDLSGDALASNVVWSFTTAANGCNPAPVVISVAPVSGGANICPNTILTATFSEAMNPATIDGATFTLMGPGTAPVAGAVTYNASSNTAIFTPSSGLTVSTVYTAAITTGAEDLFGNALASNYVWSFTTAANGCNPAPVVISVSPPNGSAGLCPNTVVTAAFSEAMNPATIDGATFTLTGPGTAPVAGAVTYNASSNTAIFTPSSSLTVSTVYTAAITTGAEDLFGNALASNYVWSFTTAANGCNPAPAVISVAPVSGAASICPNTILIATFSEAMNPSTIDGATFTLMGPGTASVAGVVSYDASSDTAIFTPSTSLALSTLYTATVTTGAQDLFGNALASNVVWTFTTGANPCQPPAPPVSVTPPIGSTGVCPNAVIAATFPQAMNPATLNPTTFTVTGPGTTPVTGTITPDVTNTIFTFTPSSGLALSTLYTATITTGAQDLFGNALATNYVWTFTTAAASCTPPPPPTVISVTPPNGAVGVCLNTVITATFSEAMNPASINTMTFIVAPGVTGIVTLDGTGRIATFTASTNLALNTTYTATITTGAQDPSGNALASNYVWSFTTATLTCQAPVPLGTAANFEILAASTVTNTGPTIISGGNLGLSPGSSVTGFPPGTLTPPAVMDITDPTAAQAQLDLTTAYNYAAGLTGGAALPGDMSNLTFLPGLYTNSGAVMLSAGSVTLDAQGNANAVFIFQVGSSLTTIGTTQVVLAGGAQAQNIFWQVGSSATLGTYSAFQGTILSLESITLDTGATVTGRALAINAAVTLDSNTVAAP
jgi:hypothetical protein